MKDNYKIVAFTPAGRNRYLEILYNYIKRDVDSGLIDEWNLWINTEDVVDIRYINFLKDENPWIKTTKLKIKYNGIFSIYSFFSDCIDEDSIYVRFDDDIVWIENGGIEKLIDFRIKNEEYFLVFPCIINNAIVAHVLQKHGVYKDMQPINYKCMDMEYLTKSYIATEQHKRLFNDIKNHDLSKYRFNKWEFKDRFSINCFAFFGKYFKTFGGEVGFDEEEWLSYIYPNHVQKNNCITSDCIVSHFSFSHQQELYANMDLLYEYKKLCQKETNG